MYIRFVQIQFNHDSLSDIQRIYNEQILARLQKVKGCLFAALIKNETSPNEGISITLWDSLKSAKDYENRGTYENLLNYLKPHLNNLTEWKIQLSNNMELEYQPVTQKPRVNAFKSLKTTDPEILKSQTLQFMYMRILTIHIKQGKLNEFKTLYEKEIIPRLEAVSGCLYAHLFESLENKNQVLSLTIWSSKKYADEYERTGTFNQLMDKVKHTFSQVYQWKLALEKENKQITTSDDISINYYKIVTGKSF